MRCQYCDYDEHGLPSIYNDGVEATRQHRRVLLRETGEYVCGTCWNAGMDFKEPEDPDMFVDFEFDDKESFEEALKELPALPDDDYN